MGLIYFANDGYFSGSSVNMVPSRAEDIMLRLKAVLKAAGWVLMGSSDFSVTSSISTTFGVAAVDVLSNITCSRPAGGSNAPAITGSLCNHGSWFVVQAPTSQSFCFQMNNDVASGNNKNGSWPNSWRFKYASKGFVMASASLTVTPRAVIQSDEIVLLGGGTDASPTFGTFWSNDGKHRVHIIAESGSNFGWSVVTYNPGAGTMDNVFLYDSVTTTNPIDPDPHVIFLATGLADSFRDVFDNAAVRTNWCLMPSSSNANRSYGRACAMRYSTTETNDASTVPNGLMHNGFVSMPEEWPVFWAMDNLKAFQSLSGGGGFKGVSNLLRWTGTPMATGEILTYTSSLGVVENRIVLGSSTTTAANCLTLPFTGSVSYL
jgi:hypothetical protein